MMNFVRCGQTFSHRALPGTSRSAAPHCATKKPIPTDGDTSTKNLIFRPISPNHRTTKDWTAVAWPTNIQSGTPDGKFGPAVQMTGWGDCWFLATLAAVANDPAGHKILAESIKQVDGGYEVTFKGSPHNNVFISDSELDQCLDESGGDADTRLMQLAADKLFSESGNFRSLFIASLMSGGMNQERAEQCLEAFCRNTGVQDEMAFNPMRDTGEDFLAYFMFTGLFPNILYTSSSITLQSRDIMAYLNWFVANDRDGVSVTINGNENPLGESAGSHNLVIAWDVIRTEITANGTVDPQQRAFLNALDNWLESRISFAVQALKSAAGNLQLEHLNPEEFVDYLSQNLFNMNQDHFNLLRSGVQDVLSGGLGYIGFTGDHVGTIEGMNTAVGTFSYSEPHYPTMVHTGKLIDLVQAIQSEKLHLSAAKPTTGRDARARSEHASTSRGRRLRQLHNQVVRDGKIDPAESGPLADLMEMEDGAFRQVYDCDKNGVIEGAELKAVKLRVDRWVEHLELTPIW